MHPPPPNHLKWRNIVKTEEFDFPMPQDNPINVYYHLLSFPTLDCTRNYTSTTSRPVPCNSPLCRSLQSNQSSTTNCDIATRNTIVPAADSGGGCVVLPHNELALFDSLALHTTNGSNTGQLIVFPEFVLTCSDKSSRLLQGHAKKEVTGLAGLGFSKYSLPAQVSTSSSVFAVCLSGSPSAPADKLLETDVGPKVPQFDLLMENDVIWHVFGKNSMVRIVEEGMDVWCLAIVNGGDRSVSSIVIGGHQLEDNLSISILLEDFVRMASADETIKSIVKFSLLRGLPDCVSGLAALGQFNYSLPSQVFGSPQVFALCLPNFPYTTEYSGVAFFNTRGPYNIQQGGDLSSHLRYTPLIINLIESTLITSFNYVPSAEYFIGLTSMKINGKLVDINPSLLTIDNLGIGWTRLSTVTPYTTLHTSIYRPFIQLFINESMAYNLTISTNLVSPFEVCLNASDIQDTWFEPKVPVIDLVMHSEDVFWKVYGSNSMVKVEGENGETSLWCLG
ncbi:basic 7S globulin-like protein, partial [Tanacetum coccineum]